MDSSHGGDSPERLRSGTMASGSCSFTVLYTQTSMKICTLTSCASSPLLLRLSPFHPVLYICHIGVPPMQLVPAPIPRSPLEMCSSKHFTLAYAKRKWQWKVCDRQKVSMPRAATDKPSPSSFHAAFIS